MSRRNSDSVTRKTYSSFIMYHICISMQLDVSGRCYQTALIVTRKLELRSSGRQLSVGLRRLGPGGRMSRPLAKLINLLYLSYTYYD